MTKEWRPENWHTEPIKQNPLHCLAPQECADSFYERGASAMLSALLKWLDEPCPHWGQGVPRHRCNDCMNELRGEKDGK